jgi:hypothetical protein
MSFFCPPKQHIKQATRLFITQAHVKQFEHTLAYLFAVSILLRVNVILILISPRLNYYYNCSFEYYILLFNLFLMNVALFAYAF